MPKTENPKPKTVPYPTPAHAEADRLLTEAAAAKSARVRAEADLAGELARLKELSPFWEALEANYLQELAREAEAAARIKAFEAEQKWDLFDPPTTAPHSIKVELPAGELFYSLEAHVIRPKKVNVLAAVEEYAALEILGVGDYQGFAEVVKISKSLNWDALQYWPPERLQLVGTDKRAKETYSFELREEG